MATPTSSKMQAAVTLPCPAKPPMSENLNKSDLKSA